MAGWIKVRKELFDSPKVQAIAQRLRISPDAVLGKIIRLWCWADTHVREEEVPWLTLSWVNNYLSQSEFAESLVLVGWIAKTDTGLRFVDFAKHNWQDGKGKALNAKRQAEFRERRSRSERYESVTKALPTSPTPTPINPPAPLQGEAASPERAPPPPEAVLTFPCVPGKKSKSDEWHLTRAKLDEYAQTFPGVDAPAEARKALQWCVDNPTKRKTASGMPDFLRRWMERAQNAAGGRGPGPAGGRPSIGERVKRLFEGDQGGFS